MKDVRKRAGLTQTEFGDRIGFHKNQVYNVETGKLIPSDDYVSSVALKYQVSVSWLKTGEGEMSAGAPEIDDRLLEWLKNNPDVIRELRLRGWQDQVGGVTDGIKYITSRPGLKQELRVDHVTLDPQTMQELNERFALIYTGQRRLARNLLRDIVGRYIGNEPDTVNALNEIQRTAALMRFELERDHVDDFARLLSEHWNLSRQIDAGSTNTLIDQIFDSVDDLLDGKMVCGAGGGGFLQVILKKGITKDQLQARLASIFQDTDIGVWDCRLV